MIRIGMIGGLKDKKDLLKDIEGLEDCMIRKD